MYMYVRMYCIIMYSTYVHTYMYMYSFLVSEAMVS